MPARLGSQSLARGGRPRANPRGHAPAALDALLMEIGSALAADRTLGGLVDWTEWSAPQTRDLAIDGAAGLKGAMVTVTLHYASSDPLG